MEKDLRYAILKIEILKIHLIVILDSHAQSINEYRQKNTLLEIFVLDKLLDASLYGAQRAEATDPGAS